MAMVCGPIEHSFGMALAADAIAGDAQMARVRIVAIRAGDPGGMHAALRKGAEFIDLVALLAVRIKRPAAKAAG